MFWFIIEIFQDETFNESNASDNINIDENNFIRKRSAGIDEQNIQTYTTSGKRLRIISEASLATALNEEDEEIEEESQQVRITTKRSESHNLQPKVESLEFLEEAAHHIQQAQQQTSKQPQNITYMNMDSFTEKTNTATNQQQQQQPATARKINENLCICGQSLILLCFLRIRSSWNQPTTSNNRRLQIRWVINFLFLQTSIFKGKINFAEDDIWVEKAIDIGSGSQSETSPKTRSANKNSAAYKANCLTPRSCPGKKKAKFMKCWCHIKIMF